MNSNTDFSYWLKEQMRQRGLNAKELADIAGVSRSNISLILNGKSNPGFDFCRAIAGVFGLPTVQVLRLAGLIEEEDQPDSGSHYINFLELIDLVERESETRQDLDLPTFSALIDIISKMTPENREDLLNYARYRYQQQEAKERK